MKKRASLAFGTMLAVVLAAGGAWAATDVKDGKDLVDTCTALLAEGTSAGSEGERCKNFLVNMIMAQKDTLTIGQPFRAERLGPDEKEQACFQLPDSLPFAEFARQVTSYSERNPGMVRRPAYELAARALEHAYPCSEDEMRDRP